MSKQMIINASASEEMRVAILESDDRGDRRLLDLDIENQARSKHKGNIYKGIVANVEDSLEAAFIEFGDDKQAFLALSEVRPALYPPELKGVRRPKISDVLKRGQEIVVQVTKDEIGNKGAAVTTYLSLPGRYVVLMHSDEPGGGVSRKVDDETARRRAREILNHIDVPEGMAVIIRTAGVSRSRLDLYRDLKTLAQQWETIDRGAQLGRAPTLLHREPDLVVRTIRDYLAPDINKIVIDSEDEFEELKGYFEALAPESVEILEHHTSRQPIFEKYGIETAIEELFEREVKLPSGGYLIIDQTEALVAIDVNSGKSNKEADHEATVYKTNLEAAREVARHLRLRDMGGIIVVDFIDMVNRRHDRDVERAVREAMKDDKARVKIARISENGTMEITRQRLRQAHRLVSHTSCPHCSGTGIVRDPRGLAVKALRELSNKVSKEGQHLSRISMKLPVEVANILANTKRRELMELGDEHQLFIEVTGDARLQGAEFKWDTERRGKAGLDAAGQGLRDPRLGDRGRGRGRGRGRRDEAPTGFGGPTLPPPSIGPVPTFLDDEVAIAEADAKDAAEEAERERLAAERVANGEVEVVEPAAVAERAHREPREPRAPRAAAEPEGPAHYDDPLTEALFGHAPEVPLAEVEAAAPAEEIAADGEGQRKRRRRRRRKKKGAADGTVAADGVEGDGDGEDGDDDEVEAGADSEVSAATDVVDVDATAAGGLNAEEEAAWAAYRAAHPTPALAVPVPVPADEPKAPRAEFADEVMPAPMPVADVGADVVAAHDDAADDDSAADGAADTIDGDEPTAVKKKRVRRPSTKAKKAAGEEPVAGDGAE
jgi:ribonuclease E